MNSQLSSATRARREIFIFLAFLLALLAILLTHVYLAGYRAGILHERAAWLAVPKNPFGPKP